MPMLRRTPPAVLVALAAFVLTPPGAVRAAWQWSVEPGVWRPRVELTAHVEDHPNTSNRVTVHESLVQSDSAGALHFECRNGAWGFFVDGTRWSIDEEQISHLTGGFGTITA